MNYVRSSHLVLQSLPAQSTKLFVRHSVTLEPYAPCRGLRSAEMDFADSIKVEYQNSDTLFLFCGASSLEWTTNAHPRLLQHRDFGMDYQCPSTTPAASGLWNGLPLPIHDSCSIGTFKSHLKTYSVVIFFRVTGSTIPRF